MRENTVLTVIVHPIEIKCHQPGKSNIGFGPGISSNKPLYWYRSLRLIRLNFSLWQNIVEFAALLAPLS